MLAWMKRPFAGRNNAGAVGAAPIVRNPTVEPLGKRPTNGDPIFFDPFDPEIRARQTEKHSRYDKPTLHPQESVEVIEQEKHAHDHVVVDEENHEVADWDTEPAEEPNAGATGADSDSPNAASPVVVLGSPTDPAVVEKERNLVEAMRVTLELPEYADDDQQRFKQQLMLLRVLRARKLDLVGAIDQYKKIQVWRAENNVDTCLDKADPLEEPFQCICPHRNHGYTYQGHPVYYERTGQARMSELMKHLTEDDVIIRHIRHLEIICRRMEVSSALHGHNIEKMVMIHDLSNMSYAIEPAGMRIFKRTTAIDQAYYPERLYKMFIINAPLSFRSAWMMAKPWLDPVTRQKVEIHGANFKDRLLEFIPPSQLPLLYGGDCVCHFSNGDMCLPHVRAYPVAEGETSPEEWPWGDMM